MKLALLADIHGNHLALEAVLKSVKTYEVDKLLIAGDFVGYYYWPKEVFELLTPWDVTAIRGNHEEMLIKAKGDSEFLKSVDTKYGKGLRVALELLTNEQIDWLSTLPFSLEFDAEDRRILLCHGSPWDHDFYIYPDADEGTIEKCVSMNYDWIVLGHTHYPMVHRSNKTTIVNPGSVGQPRNRKPGACWALLDTKTQEVNTYCVGYDSHFVVAESLRRNPDLPYLANVLERT
jgi:putative phosphoesterase